MTPACAVSLAVASCLWRAPAHPLPRPPRPVWAVSVDAGAAHPDNWLDVLPAAPLARPLDALSAALVRALALGGKATLSLRF